MENPGVFKTVMNGFEKKSVLAYIEQINERSNQVQRALNEQLEALTANIEQLNSKVQDLETENKSLSDAQELDRKEQKRLEEENLQLAARLSESERMLNESRANMADLKKELEHRVSRLTELEAQSEKYNVATSQIGAAIIEAQQRADEIISEAKAKAHDIVRNATAQAFVVSSEIRELKSGISAIRSDVSAVTSNFTQKLLGIEKDIEELSSIIPVEDAGIPQQTDAEQVTEPKDDIGAPDGSASGPAGMKQNTGNTFFR